MRNRVAAPRAAGVYLLAFYKDGAHVHYGVTPRGRALHYCGWASNIATRIRKHRKGDGARLCRAVRLAGYELRLVAVWEGADRAFERRIKNRHRLGEVCPVCRAARIGKAL